MAISYREAASDQRSTANGVLRVASGEAAPDGQPASSWASIHWISSGAASENGRRGAARSERIQVKRARAPLPKPRKAARACSEQHAHAVEPDNLTLSACGGFATLALSFALMLISKSINLLEGVRGTSGLDAAEGGDSVEVELHEYLRLGSNFCRR